jgi:hypothetical protein
VWVAIAKNPTPDARPDFSGRWLLDIEHSRVNPAISKGLTKGEVRIYHKDPSFSFWREFTKAGLSEVVEYTLNSGGEEIKGTEGGMPTISSLSWSGDELIYLTIYQTSRGEARNIVKYSLHDRGKTLRAEEVFRGPRISYENVWIFSKAP